MPRILVVAVCCAVLFDAAACRRPSEATAAAIRETLAAAEVPRALKLKVPAARWKLIQQVYADRNGRPLWIGGKTPTDRIRDLVALLCGAEREGLHPEDYDLAGLKQSMERLYGPAAERTPETAAALDIRLTVLFLDYGADLLAGRLDPRAVDDGWYIKGRRASIDSTLRATLKTDGDLDVRKAAARLRPEQPEYQQLVDALAQARAEVASAPNATERTAAEQQVRRIEVNLERYRWLPNSFGSRYIVVNIPEYTLYAYDDNKLAFTMRVIVGDEYENATPVIADSMTEVIFRPRWNVPSRILTQEMLPKLQQNADYLERNDYEVVDTKTGATLDARTIDWKDVDTAKLDVRVRQKPGPANPLGRVKFVLPNQFAIYLHDTPADQLFDKSKRTLSHGCVRVEDPERLANFVLDGQGDWTDGKIREAMRLGTKTGTTADTTEEVVKLTRPIPVYIVYLTATAHGGRVEFRDDPYQKDAQAFARLQPRVAADSTVCATFSQLLAH